MRFDYLNCEVKSGDVQRRLGWNALAKDCEAMYCDVCFDILNFLVRLLKLIFQEAVAKKNPRC